METCVTCGRTPRPDELGPGGPDVPITWTRQSGRAGRPELICPECTRSHVRSLEARLDPEWW